MDIRPKPALEHIPLTRPLLPPLSTVTEFVLEAWKAGHVANGGPVERLFTSELERKFDWRNVVCTTSCTLGLQLLCRALALEGEVIVPAFTHPATVQALRWNNITPVVGDVEPSTLTIAPENLIELITPSTSAILATHLFGNPADVIELDRIASRYGIALIFDAAAAVAVKYLSRPLTDYGTASAFSFHATKVLTTLEGGAVSTNSQSVSDEILRLRNFGISDSAPPNPLGTNAKFNDLLAAVGLAALELIDQEIARRRVALLAYQSRLERIPGVLCIGPREGTDQNYTYLPIRARNDRGDAVADQIFTTLKQANIDSRRYFGGNYQLAHLAAADFPVANSAAQDVLCLPIWGGISGDQIDRICHIVASAMR